MHTDFNRPWIVGITGASGTLYARRLIRVLIEAVPELRLEVIFSEGALRVMKEEEGFISSVGRVSIPELIGFSTDRVTVHSNRNIGATVASGSYLTQGMVIVPCSMKTLAAVAHGYSDNLVQRAADVILKERRRLVLVPRESPLSEIHLENMLKLARMGAYIVPAMPGFYSMPKSIDELVDSMVMRIIDQMGLEVNVQKRWDEILHDARQKLSTGGAVTE